MITKFQTTSVASAPKSNNTLLYIVLGAGLLYVAYKFVIKPQMEKNKQEQVK
jgi:hypothetical protein